MLVREVATKELKMSQYNSEIDTFRESLEALDTIINNWDKHWSFGGNGGEIHNIASRNPDIFSVWEVSEF